MSKRTILLFVLLLVMSENVLALGIYPGRTTIDFTPGLEKTVSFTIVNSEQKDISLVISAQGELQDYISISQNVVRMKADEPPKEISYTVRLPQQLKPGLHTTNVVVVQMPEEFAEGESEQFSVGAAVAILTQVYVNVPYPGKYGEAELNIFNRDGKVVFAVPVFSRGEFALMNVKASIDVYTSLNEKVATLYTNEIPEIAGKGRAELITEWDESNIAPGPYRAVATVSWGEGTTAVEKEFNLGEKRLNLEGIEVSDFKLGDIAKFEILVKNNWGEKVKGAFAEVVVYSESKNVLADFKSQTYDVGASEKILMNAFWDTKGVNEGSYATTLFLRSEGTSDKQELILEVKKDEILIIGAGFNISAGVSGTGISRGLLIFLITLIVILALANISWFVFLRKKFAKKK
jgi:hypothetical protein